MTKAKKTKEYSITIDEKQAKKILKLRNKTKNFIEELLQYNMSSIEDAHKILKLFSEHEKGIDGLMNFRPRKDKEGNPMHYRGYVLENHSKAWIFKK
ncbi:hypothetical protein OAV94_01150 [Candidatus Pelagibacter sp.]|nr:hypothetical protein [Candidatus Pelagibacter sp.]